MRQVEFVPFWLTDEVEVFTIRIDGKANTEINEFILMFRNSNISRQSEDFARIFQTLKNITEKGAKENFFRPEGSINDRVCALPLITAQRSTKANGTLRLYCIRVSDRLLILGGGGEKKTKTYQEDPILFEKVHTLQEIDKVLTDLEQDGIDLSKDIINLTININ